MYVDVNQKLGQLAEEYPESLLFAVRDNFLKSEQTIVVLDDDPTGTQTCTDVTVITSWNVALIAAALKTKPAVLFILTNSRSLTEPDAVKLAIEIGTNLAAAVKESGRPIVLISRSDSTLRGHFPAEVDAVAGPLGLGDAAIVIVPAFIEGGRYTIDDVHYIAEHQKLVPVSETPFAKDVVFGYKHANLKEWVEEKTNGRIKASEVRSVSLDDIRKGGPQAVAATLMGCGSGEVCIVNAASHRDLEVVVSGLMMAEQAGKKFLYRTSATIVPIRAGMESGKPYIPKNEDAVSPNGSLVIVGSHVPKSTSQLNYLLSKGGIQSLEVNVGELLLEADIPSKVAAISRQTDQWLDAGENVVIHTSRRLEVGTDSAGSLKINAAVSGFLVNILKGLTVRPKFIIGKGGITSSDLATKGLSAEKATILGPIIPGVPVWQMGPESKFPGISYVVFPGNVGDETAIYEVCKKLEG